jgi:hypothetical protein
MPQGPRQSRKHMCDVSKGVRGVSRETSIWCLSRRQHRLGDASLLEFAYLSKISDSIVSS